MLRILDRRRVYRWANSIAPATDKLRILPAPPPAATGGGGGMGGLSSLSVSPTTMPAPGGGFGAELFVFARRAAMGAGRKTPAVLARPRAARAATRERAMNVFFCCSATSARKISNFNYQRTEIQITPLTAAKLHTCCDNFEEGIE